MEIDFSLLSDSTPIEQFDCQVEELNLFLKNLALLFQKRHFGVTVVCSTEKESIIGYYTICPACIQRDKLPEKLLSGPRPNPIPAFRICRLAIHKKFQGQGYGKIVFLHALKKCLEQSKQIGGNIVIIDAKNEKAKQFYEHFGFISLPENSMILIQTIKYLEKHF